MTNTKPTSDCCNAELKVNSSDEGTSFHVCQKCNKVCDIGISWEDELINQFNPMFSHIEVCVGESERENLKEFIKKIEVITRQEERWRAQNIIEELGSGAKESCDGFDTGCCDNWRNQKEIALKKLNETV